MATYRSQFTGEQIDQAIREVNGFVVENHSDLFFNKTIKEQWFVDDSTGVGRTLGSFFAYENIPIPDGASRLYPFNDASSEIKYIRSICFYDRTNTFISGVSGNNSQVENGVAVPNGARFLSASLAYANAPSQTKGTHYLSTILGGDFVSYGLTESMNKEISEIANKENTNIRLASINFQFDDGHANDANIVSIFKQFGFTCGFGLISSLSSADVTRYLGYQDDGFEAICHADSGTGMSDPTVSPETIESRLKTSKETLEGYGFKINGFITPNSTMADVFKPILRKYYQWAETIYFGEYSGSGQPYMTPNDGVFNGWRVSLQSTTLANQKAAIDAAIENYGVLTFYGHAANLDGSDYLTTENLTALLTYIQTKVQAGKCKIGNPSSIIRDYFAVRNDDITSDWVEVSATEAELDSRFTANAWSMSYSKKQKLLYMFIRIAPSEAISGQINGILKFPAQVVGNPIIQNESGRNCICYDGGILMQGSGTWASGSYYRFSLMCRIR